MPIWNFNETKLLIKDHKVHFGNHNNPNFKGAPNQKHNQNHFCDAAVSTVPIFLEKFQQNSLGGVICYQG